MPYINDNGESKWFGTNKSVFQQARYPTTPDQVHDKAHESVAERTSLRQQEQRWPKYQYPKKNEPTKTMIMM